MIEPARLSQLGVGIARPLLTVQTIMEILDTLTEDGVLRLAEKGALPFVFDIRSRRAARRCLRIFCREARELDEVMATILPGRSETVSAVWLCRRFTCSPSHIHTLIADRLLRRQPGRIGQHESPLLYRESAIDFLKERRLA